MVFYHSKQVQQHAYLQKGENNTFLVNVHPFPSNVELPEALVESILAYTLYYKTFDSFKWVMLLTIINLKIEIELKS